jgi:hypothetical protein
MKLRTISSKVFVVLVALGLMVSSFASADGMLIPPPSKTMYETDQKAVIFYEDGIENLVLSITFQGDAEDFAWIVPTPAKPEVEKSTKQLFERLDELTRPEQVVPTQRDGLGLYGATNDVMEEKVTVLETKQIDYYEISVLESSDSQTLYNWLNDHGYRFPQAGSYIIDEYIQQGWLFTAIKIDNQKEAMAQGQLNSGNAVPLKLSFATEQMVYPLKISSLSGVQDDAPEGQISYVEGVDGGKAAKLDSDRIVATDKVVSDFSAGNGKISFYLKKRDDDPVQKIVSVRGTTKQGEETESVSVSNAQKNVFQILINKNYREQYQVDLGSDFKQNVWQKYDFVWEPNANGVGYSVKFSVDGIERTLNKVYSSVTREVATEELPRVIVGGDYFEPVVFEKPVDQDSGDYYNRSMEMSSKPQINVYRKGDILIDKLEINSNKKNIVRADFEDNLDVVLAGEQANLMRVFEKSNNAAYGAQNMYIQDSMGVLLYVFSDKKYDIPGFDVQYAGWMEGDDVGNIAKLDGKTPWISPKNDKYFLTRYYSYMTTSQMTEDLYPQESEDQTSFNYAGGNDNKMIWIYLLVGIAFASVGVMVWFVIRKEKGKAFLPMKNEEHSLMKKETKK